MNASTSKNQVALRGSRLMVGVTAALVLALGFGAGAGRAAELENTATVSFHLTDAGKTFALRSNTVVTPVLPAPTRARLGFLRIASGSPGPGAVPLDGGECRAIDGGFGPLPPAFDPGGTPVDGGADVGPVEGFTIGETLVVRVEDADRNLDPTVRESVDVDITTTAGDVETIRLRETGPDTGVFAAGIQGVPVPPPATRYDCVLSAGIGDTIDARYVDPLFPANIASASLPATATLADRMVLRLESSVSRQVVEVGDFLQYTLVLRNLHDQAAYRVRITDELPPGVRYREGSLRVGPATGGGAGANTMPAGAITAMATGAAPTGNWTAVEPDLAAGGRELGFAAGDLPPGASVTATFVAEVGSGAVGPELVNRAIARAAGAFSSNWTEAAVRMREALASTGFTIVGRVVQAASCDAGAAAGVPGIRVMLDDGTYVATDANGAYHFEGVRPGTHVVQVDTATLPAGAEPLACAGGTRFAGTAFSQFVEAQGGTLWRADFHIGTASPGPGPLAPPAGPPAEPGGAARPAIVDDRTAGGGNVDWLAGQAPGVEWLFPAPDYNPRAPSTRIVIKHLPGQVVVLTARGKPVDPLNAEGTRTSADNRVAVSSWRALELVPGANAFVAEIRGPDGGLVERLSRPVHFVTSVARAELVPEQSLLVADGLTRPVLAVRMLDASGRPLRGNSTGSFSVAPPYRSAASVRELQEQRVIGRPSTESTWTTSGDEGIAFIELQPTSLAGNVELTFPFQGAGGRQQLRAWLKSTPRDWIVVGFARGSAGYDTLRDNMQGLSPDEDGSGWRGDGQVSLYAKGRVLGEWMLTLAYDSDKPTGRLRREGLLSTIDPQQYYTLYGDGSAQAYDAASIEKLYLKLERDQFHALFGDFQTGLDRTELSRYQRTLNGVKVEYRGPMVEFNGFAARTAQAYARDEMQGDGTSGLYRLGHGGILMNSERVRIETRDRFHSEQVLQVRELARHIDYDIDYERGTLFFREPVASRDFDFNPNIIVVEYETRGTADRMLNAGGRVGVHLLDDRLQAGLSYLRDEDAGGRSDLAGIDVRYRPGGNDELRLEAARSRSLDLADADPASAWLLEWEHRDERLDLLAYARRNGPGFGLGQQNRSEAGTFKAGTTARWTIDRHFALQGEAYRMENLASGAVRHAASAELSYRGDGWGASAGLQWVHDEAPGGEVAESRQATLGANRSFFDDRLELGVQADLSLGGRNDSVDFPTRLQLTAAYRVNEAFRVLAAQEFTDGEDRDTATTRFGFEASPWRNARLTSTLNQSRITEYGPRTFALFGLDQKFILDAHWSLDAALDSSHAFNESGDGPLVVDPTRPIAPGGIRDGGALTEDFTALSGGVTYQAELWTWNARVEGRQSDSNDRRGITSAFLRQARDGVALAAQLQAFSQDNADGSKGLLASAQLAWAYRPPGSRWSMLDKLEFRVDELTGVPGSRDVRSRRLVNNFALNYLSDGWEGGTGTGMLSLDQRSQFSLYYGARYVLDSYGDDDYSGYSDIIGFEWRHDLGDRLDIGVRSSVLHSWSLGTWSWAFGPSLGFSPFANAWVSVGYNIRGFQDRDFEQAHHTAQGPYLVFRLKFDQQSLRLDRTVRTALNGR